MLVAQNLQELSSSQGADGVTRQQKQIRRLFRQLFCLFATDFEGVILKRDYYPGGKHTLGFLLKVEIVFFMRLELWKRKFNSCSTIAIMTGISLFLEQARYLFLRIVQDVRSNPDAAEQ